MIREEFTKEYRGVVIDAPTLYEEVSSYVEAIAPELADRIEQYDAAAENLPLFEKFHVHEQLHKALDRKVWLPSGGSLVIERTEALTVIDVNTGKNVGTSNLEETVYRNNLEAADAVARELRLRDIGGHHRHRLHRHGDQGEPRSSRGSVPPGAGTRQDAHAGVLDLRARPARDDTQARVGRSGRSVLVDLSGLQRAWVRRRRIDARVAVTIRARCVLEASSVSCSRVVSCSPRAVATTTTRSSKTTDASESANPDQAPADAAIAAFAHEAEDQGFTAAAGGKSKGSSDGSASDGSASDIQLESEACKQFSDAFQTEKLTGETATAAERLVREG